MKYKETIRAEFLRRINRFCAEVLVNGAVETVHVKNTGRLRELFIVGAVCALCPADNPARKTKYDLVGILRGDVWVNVDSQIPNDAAEEYVRSGAFGDVTPLKREYTLGDSRFDICCRHGDTVHLIEVKGVTLNMDGVACFPDAPTQRGEKHLRGLIRACEAGYRCTVLFIAAMPDVTAFTPNTARDPAFAEALRDAARSGVEIRAVRCDVTEDSITAADEIPVLL